MFRDHRLSGQKAGEFSTITTLIGVGNRGPVMPVAEKGRRSSSLAVMGGLIIGHQVPQSLII